LNLWFHDSHAQSHYAITVLLSLWIAKEFEVRRHNAKCKRLWRSLSTYPCCHMYLKTSTCLRHFAMNWWDFYAEYNSKPFNNKKPSLPPDQVGRVIRTSVTRVIKQLEKGRWMPSTVTFSPR
jgi:hypothetical protein